MNDWGSTKVKEKIPESFEMFSEEGNKTIGMIVGSLLVYTGGKVDWEAVERVTSFLTTNYNDEVGEVMDTAVREVIWDVLNLNDWVVK